MASMALAVVEAEKHSLLIPAADRVREYITHARAKNTVRGYRSAFRHFREWCETRGLVAIPAAPETISLYLAEHGDVLKAATLQHRLSAISKAHRAAGYESPCSMRFAVVSEVWAGIKRTHGVAQIGKEPILTENLKEMMDCLPDGLLGIRDRALLLVGFAGAFRRSELVGLDVEDLQFTDDGLVITLRRSKTDQEGQGRKVGIPYGSNPDTCPVRAMRAWMQASGITAGPVFRYVDRHARIHAGRLSGGSVALIVKRRAEPAGLQVDRYAGHSLRAGLVTSAAARGVPERCIMNQSGHRSITVMRKYIRDASLFRENAAARVGL